MFNRRDVHVRPLHEELSEIGLDPDKIMNDIEHNAGVLSEGGNPLTSGARLVTEADEDDFVQDELEFDDDDELGEDVEDELEFDDDLDEAVKMKRTGFKEVDGKMVRVTKAEKQKAKIRRKKEKAKARAAQRMYRKRFRRKIAKRRKMLAKKGPARKGFRRQVSSASMELANLREELESVSAVDGEVTPYVEAAVNAGYLSALLGEIFECIGDQEAGEMLYTMSDSAVDLSEAIEANGGELSEEFEPKLTSLLEGVSKALAAHENLGSPSLFEAIEEGIENGNPLFEDLDDDDDEDFEDDDDFDFEDEE